MLIMKYFKNLLIFLIALFAAICSLPILVAIIAIIDMFIVPTIICIGTYLVGLFVYCACSK